MTQAELTVLKFFNNPIDPPTPLRECVLPPHQRRIEVHTLVKYCDISMQYYAAKEYTHHCTYAMSRDILNVLTGTHFAGFFYTN
jgi:hypothetical protein